MTRSSHSESVTQRRTIRSGKVLRSNRTVYVISEDDIIGVAEERGVQLTPEQLDSISDYVRDHFSPSGEWHDVIVDGLDALLVIRPKE